VAVLGNTFLTACEPQRVSNIGRWVLLAGKIVPDVALLWCFRDDDFQPDVFRSGLSDTGEQFVEDLFPYGRVITGPAGSDIIDLFRGICDNFSQGRTSKMRARLLLVFCMATPCDYAAGIAGFPVLVYTTSETVARGMFPCITSRSASALITYSRPSRGWTFTDFLVWDSEIVPASLSDGSQRSRVACGTRRKISWLDPYMSTRCRASTGIT